MAVSYSSNRVTINGSFASGGATITASTTLVRTTGDVPATSWIGRLVAFVPSTTSSADTQVRLVTGVSGNNVTVHDPWLDKGDLIGDFRVAHNLQDVHDIGNAALQKIGSNTFRWDADWDVINSGFLGDLDIAIEMEKSSSGTLWQVGNGGIVQFGLLWGGEGNDAIETTNGCSLYFNKTSTSSNSIYSNTNAREENGGVINYYGSLIQSSTTTPGNWAFQRMTGPMRFIGCSFDGPMGGRFYHEATEWIQCRMSGNNDSTPAWSLGATFTRDIADIIFYQNDTVLKNFGSFTGVLRNTIFTDSNGLIFLDQGSGQIDFVDCTTVVADSPDQFQFKSVNYTITSSTGTPLPNILVRINDKDDVVQGSLLSSGIDGVVPEILANFRRGLDDFTPFRIRIRAFGFIWSSLVSAIADPIKQSIALNSDPFVTQTDTMAQAHTGITIIDEPTPVSWNGLDFGITVRGDLTVNAALTIDDIKHYLHYVLSQNASIAGASNGLEFHDFIPMSGFETTRDSYGAVNKGVRIVDENDNPFLGVTRMQSDDGTFYVSPIVISVSAPQLIDDTRVRLYNDTQGVEIDNSVVSGGSGYVIVLTQSTEYNDGDTLILLATYQIGGVAKNVFRAVSVATDSNIIFGEAQTDWEEHNLVGIDGSTISECSTNFVQIQVEVNDPDNSTEKSRIAAFIVDALTSADGIRNWVALDGSPVISYSGAGLAIIEKSIADLEFDNIKNIPLDIIDPFKLRASDGSSLIANSTFTIRYDDSAVAIVVETPTSGLTTSESEQLAAIKPDLSIINEGLKKTSLLVPHSDNLTT